MVRAAKAIPALIGAAGLGTLAAWYRLFRQPLPKVSGKLTVMGLGSSVDILRDRYRVPHVRAGSLIDLIFAQGFCHGQDRFWQMAFLRSVASGRLSEFAGAQTLAADKLMRTLGFMRLAQAEVADLPVRMRETLDAYSAGVNAALQAASVKPTEFQILGLEPEPWRPQDTLAAAKVLSLGLCVNWESELMRSQLVSELGPELAAQLEPQYPRASSVVMGPSQGYQGRGVQLAAQIAAVRELVGMANIGGSNNWAVSGQRSATGKPLLASDPHLTAAMPNVWHQIQLQCDEEGIDAHGATLPGMWGIAIGQNRDVAWGFTNAFADVQDLFVERVRKGQDGASAYEYEFKGKWLAAELTHEEIVIKGRNEPERLEVIKTHHGPIINGSLAAEHEPQLALRWTALDFPGISLATVDGLKASCGDDIGKLFSDYSSPALNLVWADSEGNIGYQMIGKVPIRKGGVADLPRPGWSGKHEWEGYIPHEKLPSLKNPRSGFIVTANNRIVDDSYPYHISSDWQDGYRVQRIEELLSQREKHTIESFHRIQTDVYSIQSVEVAERLGQATFEGQREVRAQERIRSWDGELDKDTVAGTIVQAFIVHLCRIFTAEVIEDPLLAGHYLASSATEFMPVSTSLWRSRTRILELWQQSDARWFKQGRSWREITIEAFCAALDELEQRFGRGQSRWRWGRAHRIEYEHPFGDINPVLALIFSRQAAGVGAEDTVCQVGYLPTDPYKGKWMPSYRWLADLSDPGNSRWQMPAGESGHPGSPHYHNLRRSWGAGKLLPIYRSHDEARSAGRSKLLWLEPAS